MLVASLALVSVAITPATWSWSVAKTEIVPPEPLPLGGYTARMGRRPDPGGEPLFARTLLVRKGGYAVAIVSIEMLTVPESLVREVRARIPPDTHLFLTATHTHCAPDSQMLNDRMTFAIPGIAKFDPKWLPWFADRIAASVRAAANAPSQAFGWELRRSRVAANRGRRPGTFPDQTFTECRSPVHRSVVFGHYAAHAVLWGAERNQTSGDWPGAYAMARGGDTLMLIGAIGGVSPAAPGDDPASRIRALVEALLRSRDPGPAGWTKLEPSAAVGYTSRPIALQPPNANAEFARMNKIPQALASTVVKTIAPKEGHVTAMRIGKLALVGVPGEPSPALAQRIVSRGRAAGFDPVLVVSHVNGWIGYILEADDYARGGYEASLGFHGSGAAQAVVDASAAAIGELRSQGR